MRASMIITALFAALPVFVAANTDCEWLQPAIGVDEGLRLGLQCPPSSSLGQGDTYTEAWLETNKCLANDFGTLVPRKDGNAWHSCNFANAKKGDGDDVISDVICGPATTATSIAISDFATSVSSWFECEGYTATVYGPYTTGTTELPTTTAAAK